jgi:hypothetical protein
MADAGQLATSRQLALALFEDASGQGLSVDAARSDIGFARNNILIRIVDLGVAARRLIDAAYFIVAQEQDPRDIYEVELDYFKWLMRYSSRNNAHLEQVITEAQKALIQATAAAGDDGGERPFGSTQLIGRISYQGGRFQFRVPPDLIGIIRGKGKSHWLSLRITSLDELRGWQGEMGANAQVFKYFKRDWLDPAVQQINDVSDLTISYESRTLPGSRKIGSLRFRLTRKDVAERLLHTHEHAQEIYQALKREFGLSTAQFSQIAAARDTYTDERLEQAIDRTRFSLKIGKVTKSPAGFFMKALKEGWQVSDAEREMLQVQQNLALREQQDAAAKEQSQAQMKFQTAAQEVNARERIAEELRQGWTEYERASTEQQDDWRRTYKRTPAGKLILRRLNFDPMADLTADAFVKHSELKDAFAGYVFTRTKANRARGA